MKLLIGALFLSIWHSILFWKQEIGVSALLFAIPAVNLTIQLLDEKTRNKKAWLIIILIILLSSTYLIFDNPLFQLLNKFIIPLLYLIMIILLNSTAKSIIEKIVLLVCEPFNYFGEVLAEIKKQIMTKFEIKKYEKEVKEKHNVVKAIFCTLAILFVVLGLLITADKEFEELFVDILKGIENFSVPTLAFRIITIIFMFFYISSFFINSLSKYNGMDELEDKEGKKKDSLTIYMILTTLNIVYLAFCYIQIKSLLTIENIKYSEYARQGFFQLMLVSLINIIMILQATSKKLRETEKEQKYKKIMCIIMLVFTLIIIISSFIRMSLYQANYGDTRLRILVNFTLITEIILLIPTAVYILKPNINLLKYYFIIIVSMYCVVNFINIDKMIAKNNIDRYIETGKIDVWYLVSLDSTDVTKELVRLQNTNFEYTEKPENKTNYQNKLNKYLDNLKTQLEEKTTLPEFNFSKWKAMMYLGGK